MEDTLRMSEREFWWDFEDFMNGSLDSQRLAKFRREMPRYFPAQAACKACAAGYHGDPGSQCSCPCHQITEVRHAA